MLSVRCQQGHQADKKIVTSLQGLALGKGSISPAFASGTTAYTGATSDASETVTATLTDNDDTLELKYNGEAIESGDTVEWAEGDENVITAKVIDHGNPDVSTTYTLTVTYTPSNADEDEPGTP